MCHMTNIEGFKQYEKVHSVHHKFHRTKYFAIDIKNKQILDF